MIDYLVIKCQLLIVAHVMKSHQTGWKLLDRYFKTQGIQRTTWKGANRTASYGNSFQFASYIFQRPNFKHPYKKGYKILKLKFTYFVLYQYSFMSSKKIQLHLMLTVKKNMFS